MEQETVNIKEYILKQKSKWDYIFHFSEEIDSITNVDIILQIANLVKIKHQELLKKKQPNKTLMTPAKKEHVEQPTNEVFRAKFNAEELRAKDGKVCSKCIQKKPIDDFYTSKTNGDGRQSYCKVCQKKQAKESKVKAKKKKGLKKARKQIDSKISMRKKGIFIPVYETTITPEEISIVLKVMQKVEYGFVPTTDSLVEETGLKLFKVRAVLLYLLGMNRIKKKYGGDKGKVRYEVVLA